MLLFNASIIFEESSCLAGCDDILRIEIKSDQENLTTLFLHTHKSLLHVWFNSCGTGIFTTVHHQKKTLHHYNQIQIQSHYHWVEFESPQVQLCVYHLNQRSIFLKPSSTFNVCRITFFQFSGVTSLRASFTRILHVLDFQCSVFLGNLCLYLCANEIDCLLVVWVVWYLYLFDCNIFCYFLRYTLW